MTTISITIERDGIDREVEVECSATGIESPVELTRDEEHEVWQAYEERLDEDREARREYARDAREARSLERAGL